MCVFVQREYRWMALAHIPYAIHILVKMFYTEKKKKSGNSMTGNLNKNYFFL